MAERSCGFGIGKMRVWERREWIWDRRKWLRMGVRQRIPGWSGLAAYLIPMSSLLTLRHPYGS